MELNKVIFSNVDEYLLKRNKMYDNIKKTIIECVTEDTFEYEHMSYQGLTSRQRLYIIESLSNELQNFTQNKCNDWCDDISFKIILGIEGFLDGLVKINKINNFTGEEYADLIHNSIVYQLDNDKHYPCLLEHIKLEHNNFE